MNTTKPQDHTPLPWEARPVPDMKCIVIAQVGMMLPHAHVTTPTARLESLTAVEYSNAQLIVRACNAHHALVDALTALRDESWLDASPSDTEYLASAKKRALAALAAAGGEAAQDTPVHQVLADVLRSSRFGSVAEDFILQSVLNAAHATARLTPATLVMDEGPISKEDWIGAAAEIRTRLSAVVRANFGLETEP